MRDCEAEDRRRRFTLIDWVVLCALVAFCFLHALTTWATQRELAEDRAPTGTSGGVEVW